MASKGPFQFPSGILMPTSLLHCSATLLLLFIVRDQQVAQVPACDTRHLLPSKAPLRGIQELKLYEEAK